MPRSARASAAGYCYHVINRGNARAKVFHKDEDMEAFVRIMREAGIRVPMRVVACCLFPGRNRVGEVEAVAVKLSIDKRSNPPAEFIPRSGWRQQATEARESH